MGTTTFVMHWQHNHVYFVMSQLHTDTTTRMAKYATIVTSKLQTGSETVTSSLPWKLIHVAVVSLTVTNCTLILLEKDVISARQNLMSSSSLCDSFERGVW